MILHRNQLAVSTIHYKFNNEIFRFPGKSVFHLSQIEVTRNLKFHLVQPATQEESRERIANGKNLEADDVGGELTLLDVHDSAKSDAYIPPPFAC